jgi:hypothetical protein
MYMPSPRLALGVTSIGDREPVGAGVSVAAAAAWPSAADGTSDRAAARRKPDAAVRRAGLLAEREQLEVLIVLTIVNDPDRAFRPKV